MTTNPPRPLGPTHPLALIVLALIFAGGAWAMLLRMRDGVGDLTAAMHMVHAVLLALLPPFYGIAINRRWPLLAALTLLVLAALVGVDWSLYLDLSGPQEVPAEGGFVVRPAVPDYRWTPICFSVATLLCIGHGLLRALRGRRRLDVAD